MRSSEHCAPAGVRESRLDGSSFFLPPRRGGDRIGSGIRWFRSQTRSTTGYYLVSLRDRQPDGCPKVPFRHYKLEDDPPPPLLLELPPEDDEPPHEPPLILLNCLRIAVPCFALAIAAVTLRLWLPLLTAASGSFDEA